MPEKEVKLDLSEAAIELLDTFAKHYGVEPDTLVTQFVIEKLRDLLDPNEILQRAVERDRLVAEEIQRLLDNTREWWDDPPDTPPS